MTERHPLLRLGERDPIEPYKRRLIYERDGFACQWCGASGQINHLQLDHITPWSAMGSDRSDNLRTLCAKCNEDRSNFIDRMPPRVVGVTRACYWCLTKPAYYAYGEYFEAAPAVRDETEPADHVQAYCARCGTTSWVPDRSWIL